MEYIKYLHKTLIEHDGEKCNYFYRQLNHAIAKERLAIRSVSELTGFI
jgi:hypothetical protein